MRDLPRARGLRQAHLFGAARVYRSGLRHCILPLLRSSLFRCLGALARKPGLALRFGLSRSSVNLGMLELERKGFVRIVPRKGAFVSDFLHEATPQTLSVIMEYGSSQMDESLLHDLMDMRALIECECARLACLSGRGPADTELPRLMAAIRSSSGTEQIEAICDYHYHLTKLSGNDVYAMTFKAFHGPLRGLTSEHYRSAAGRQRAGKLPPGFSAGLGARGAAAAARGGGGGLKRPGENLSGKKRRR